MDMEKSNAKQLQGLPYSGLAQLATLEPHGNFNVRPP